MNNVILNFETASIRTIVDDNTPWWALVDVCNVLEMTNPSMVVQTLDDDERAKFNLGRQGDAWFVNESGLYHVILTSHSPKAKPFRRRVTHEVLPAIRKQGYYTTLSAEETIKALAKGLEYDQFQSVKVDQDGYGISWNDASLIYPAVSCTTGERTCR